MLNQILKSSNNKFVLALLIDFSKAYDSIWIDGLMYKLFNIGIRGQILNLIYDFLKFTTVQLHFNQYSGDCFARIIGLLQGSILASLLFILYVADIFNDSNIDPNVIFKYADDLSALSINDDIYEAVSTCQNICDIISSWCHKWRLVVNTSDGKSEILPIGFKIADYNIDNIIIQNRTINFVEKSPILGLHFDTNLSWQFHANKILSRSWYKWKRI